MHRLGSENIIIIIQNLKIYYYRYDLTDEEAYDLGRRAIYHATFRDAASGGIVRVYHMKPTGYEIISEEDCKDLHYRYAEEKK